MKENIPTFLRRQFIKGYYALLFLFLYKRFKYPDFYKEYRFIKNSIYNPIKYNLLIQRVRLFNLVKFAIDNVPYYKEIAKEKNIRISKTTIFEDIKKFPILTKDIIRKNWKKLHPNLSKVKYIYETSGGTTGEPIELIQDDGYCVKNISFHWISHEITGYKLGEKLIMLWGDERDTLKQTQGIIKKVINKFITNYHIQNAFRMSDEIMLRYTREINEIRPKVIFAYVQSIYELAKFIKKKNLKITPVKSIITTAGVLTEDVKDFIENIFACRVYNRYGSREVSVIAMSCEKDYKLHINMYQQYVEILNEDGEVLSENERGNIIVTNLINFGMPLIRYKIGDRGSLNLSQCSCGRGLIRLNNVYGRTVDLFKTQDGELIDGEYFTHLFYFRKNIQQFQVVQEKIDEIHVNIITMNKQKLDDLIESEFTEKIRIAMGENCRVVFNYVSNIDPTSSGKLRFTISKVN